MPMTHSPVPTFLEGGAGLGVHLDVLVQVYQVLDAFVVAVLLIMVLMTSLAVPACCSWTAKSVLHTRA